MRERARGHDSLVGPERHPRVSFVEGCESGRIGTLGKRVWGNPPWVRIPLPPPKPGARFRTDPGPGHFLPALDRRREPAAPLAGRLRRPAQTRNPAPGSARIRARVTSSRLWIGGGSPLRLWQDACGAPHKPETRRPVPHGSGPGSLPPGSRIGGGSPLAPLAGRLRRPPHKPETRRPVPHGSGPGSLPPGSGSAEGARCASGRTPAAPRTGRGTSVEQREGG